MGDSVLNRFLTPDSSIDELLPIAVLFMIIWCIVWIALLRMNLFPRRVGVVLSICVTLLALFGITDEHLEWIIKQYAAMAIALLIMLVGAIRIFWMNAVKRKE
jgi:hypothetical protein